MNRTWDGGVALAKILEILPCNNSKFFPASCFLSALVVLVLSAAAGLMTFYFYIFSFLAKLIPRHYDDMFCCNFYN